MMNEEIEEQEPTYCDDSTPGNGGGTYDDAGSRIMEIFFTFPPDAPHVPKAKAHPTLTSGTHFTHVLGADGCLVQCNSTRTAELICHLDGQGFVEGTHPPLTTRSAMRSTLAADVRALAKGMNAAHDGYVAGSSDLEGYVARIFEFLEDFGSESQVSEFISENAEKLEDKTFCPNSKAFAPYLKAAWNAFNNNQAPELEERGADTELETKPADEDYIVDGDGSLADIKRSKSRAAIISAYKGYVAKAPGSVEQFFTLILDFGRKKAAGRLYTCPEHALDVDDVASRIAEKVWLSLDNFKGEPKSFYPWLNRIAFTSAIDAVRVIKKNNSGRVELEVEDKENPLFTEQNPLIFLSQPCYDPVSWLKSKADIIPVQVQGLDRTICRLSSQGLSYNQIAQTLGLTVPAIKMRVSRMRGAAKAA